MKLEVELRGEPIRVGYQRAKGQPVGEWAPRPRVAAVRPVASLSWVATVAWCGPIWFLSTKYNDGICHRFLTVCLLLSVHFLLIGEDVKKYSVWKKKGLDCFAKIHLFLLMPWVLHTTKCGSAVDYFFCSCAIPRKVSRLVAIFIFKKRKWLICITVWLNNPPHHLKHSTRFYCVDPRARV